MACYSFPLVNAKRIKKYKATTATRNSVKGNIETVLVPLFYPGDRTHLILCDLGSCAHSKNHMDMHLKPK